MSISKDEKFRELLEELMTDCLEEKTTREFIDSLDKRAETLNKLIDYIDDYVRLQINLEEASISFYEGLKNMPEWQKEINKRMEKVLEENNDKEGESK